MARSLAILYLCALAIALALSVHPMAGLPDIRLAASRNFEHLVALAGAGASLETAHVLRTLFGGAFGAALLVTTAFAVVVTLSGA